MLKLFISTDLMKILVIITLELFREEQKVCWRFASSSLIAFLVSSIVWTFLPCPTSSYPLKFSSQQLLAPATCFILLIRWLFALRQQILLYKWRQTIVADHLLKNMQKLGLWQNQKSILCVKIRRPIITVDLLDFFFQKIPC